MKSTYQTIDEYIAQADTALRPVLQEFRKRIHKCAPQATEKISYQMPTFYLNGNLVHFMACKNHIGFYPTPSGVAQYAKELDSLGLKYSKGAIQFPIDQPMPWKLIEKIVRYRVSENQ